MYFFLELCSLLSFGPFFFFFVPACLLHIKGWSLRCLCRATHFLGLRHCMWGKGPRGNNVTWSALSRLSVPFPLYLQAIWALLVLIPRGGWVCVCSRTLWVSPTNSPVSLGASPTASTQVLSVRDFEALFPCAGTLGCEVCLAPQLFLLVYPHANEGQPTLPATTLLPVLSAPAACLHPFYQSG